MSDRDFAQLQMRRNSSTSGRERANLTRQINAELDRRKRGSSADLGSRRAGGKTRDAQEQKVAEGQWSRLGAAARQHSGMVGPESGGLVEVHFPNAMRAAGFYDQMVSSFMDAEFAGVNHNSRVVRVRNPRLSRS
jgi:hypothetical protein